MLNDTTKEQDWTSQITILEVWFMCAILMVVGLILEYGGILIFKKWVSWNPKPWYLTLFLSLFSVEMVKETKNQEHQD